MSDPNAPIDPFAAGREPEQPSAPGQPTPPPPGQTPPPYGAQPPAYGAQPPAYGAQPPVYGAQPPAPYGGGFAGQPAYGYPKNSLGVWSLVLGIAAFVLSCGFFAGIPAIIVGNMGKRAAAEGLANNPGLSKAGVILGWIATVLSLIAVIFFVILIANGDWETVINDLNDANINNM